jgi:hypothetical protein
MLTNEVRRSQYATVGSTSCHLPCVCQKLFGCRPAANSRDNFIARISCLDATHRDRCTHIVAGTAVCSRYAESTGRIMPDHVIVQLPAGILARARPIHHRQPPSSMQRRERCSRPKYRTHRDPEGRDGCLRGVVQGQTMAERFGVDPASAPTHPAAIGRVSPHPRRPYATTAIATRGGSLRRSRLASRFQG